MILGSKPCKSPGNKESCIHARVVLAKKPVKDDGSTQDLGTKARFGHFPVAGVPLARQGLKLMGDHPGDGFHARNALQQVLGDERMGGVLGFLFRRKVLAGIHGFKGTGVERDATQLRHHGGNFKLPRAAQGQLGNNMLDISAHPRGTAECCRAHQAEHFGEDIDGAAQGLLQQLFLGADQVILRQGVR